MKSLLKNKYSKLANYLKSIKKTIVAYSGGVDSTFLLNQAFTILGRDNVLAVTAVSETYTKDELKSAKKYCKDNKINHQIIRTRELQSPDFIKNPPERCYYCKKELFSKLKEIARKYKINHIADGTNIDDYKDFRPGQKAKKELGVISPLAVAKLTKDDVRKLSKKFDLNTHNKPSMACLSSRFPYGTKITKEKIMTVEKAEKYLRRLGILTIRARHHGTIARIECNPKDFNKILSNKINIIKYFKKLGFKYITLDIEGFQSGSMNKVLFH